MKLAKHANNLSTNAQDSNNFQNFGIGDASVVIEILRNRLYEHKIQTLVQEYISNARDSHREIDNTINNFEIMVPTLLNPVFSVRDFGMGISPERMAKVFILYGSSTKRDSDSQTGGFGIGAKSAFSYSDSFSIVTIVNGTKRSYVAHVGANNQGRLDLISTVSTSEKNGTEIQVAVKRNDINEFRDAILRAIHFWDDKPTLKGILDAPSLVKGLTIGNTLEVAKTQLIPDYVSKNWDSEPIAVIDGIPYPIGDKLLNSCPTLQKLTDFIRLKPLFHIANGVVEVSASRESIADSTKTKDALEKLANKVFMEVRTHIADQFQSVQSASKYFETYQTFNNAFNIEKGFASYKEYKIEDNEIGSELFKKVLITQIHCRGRHGKGKIEKITKKVLIDNYYLMFPLNNFNDLFFIDKKESLISQNKRVKAYFSEPNKDCLYTVEMMNDKVIFDKVVSDLNVKDFQSITYEVVPKEEKAKVSREKTEFCVHMIYGGNKYVTLDTNSQKWFYVSMENSYALPELRDLSSYLNDAQNTRICTLSVRSIEMVKNDPNFSPLQKWLDNFKPSRKELNHAKILKNKNGISIETLLLIKDIDDPKIREMINEYKQLGKTTIEAFPNILLQKINKEKEVIEFLKKDEEFENLLMKTYPLIIAASGQWSFKTKAQEFVYYLNAKFAQK